MVSLPVLLAAVPTTTYSGSVPLGIVLLQLFASVVGLVIVLVVKSYVIVPGLSEGAVAARL